MNDLAVWVMGWNADGNERLAERLRSWGGVPHVFTRCDVSRSEAQNYNCVIRWSEEHDFRYILVTDSDVDFLYRETIPKMYDWLDGNRDAGSIRPWRKGEPEQVAQYPPEVKYVEDGTALMWRLNTGAYYDEEFLFTGWSDYDWGNQLQALGLKNYSDRRWPVLHDMTGSNSHNRSSFLNAMKKYNKLLLDFKWWKIGIQNWRGIAAYNESVPLDCRIPTMNQIAAYTNEQQELFQSSVSPEHHTIWLKDKRDNPNLVWLNPIIVGYNTREKFEREHGYS